MAAWRTSVLAVATALALLAFAPAPADAATYNHRDKTHDVNDTSQPPCPTCFPTAPAPKNRTEDILGFGINYEFSGLHLRVGTRSTPASSRVPQVAWSVHTSTDLDLIIVVDATHGRPEVRVEGGGRKCDDTVARFTEGPRTWRVDLSTKCLRGASWVQAGAVTQALSFNDDALVDGITCCSAPALSPRVTRG